MKCCKWFFASHKIMNVKANMATNSRAIHRTSVEPDSPNACNPAASNHGCSQIPKAIVTMNIKAMPIIPGACSIILARRLSSLANSRSTRFTWSVDSDSPILLTENKGGFLIIGYTGPYGANERK